MVEVSCADEVNEAKPRCHTPTVRCDVRRTLVFHPLYEEVVAAGKLWNVLNYCTAVGILASLWTVLGHRPPTLAPLVQGLTWLAALYGRDRTRMIRN